MPLKNTEEQLNEAKHSAQKRVLFFSNRQEERRPLLDKSKKSTTKNLKSNRPIKYSTVFMLDKVDLKVTDEEIAEAEKPTDFQFSHLPVSQFQFLLKMAATAC